MPVASRPSVWVSGLRSRDSPIAWARPCLPLTTRARTSPRTASSSPSPRSSLATSDPRSSTRRGRAPEERGAGRASLRPAGVRTGQSRRGNVRARRRTRLARRLITDHVKLRTVLHPEAVTPAEVLVDRPSTPRPRVVVVEHDAAAGYQERRDARQADHRRLVPVAVEVREGDRLLEPDRVLEEALHQLDVVVGDGRAVTGEGVGHLLVEIVPVPVVLVATGALGIPGRDPRVTAMDVGAVPFGRRRDHAEDVVDLHRTLRRLGGRDDDGRAATGGPRLHERAGHAVAFELDG